MTLQELCEVLKKTGLPVACLEFDSSPKFPCIVYCEEESAPIFADDTIHKELRNIRIELYSSKKRNLKAEETLESTLTENEIIYTRNVVGVIKSENLHETEYEIQI